MTGHGAPQGAPSGAAEWAVAGLLARLRESLTERGVVQWLNGAREDFERWAEGSAQGGVAPPMLPQAPFWHAYADEAEALAVLTRMACPASCVGVVNDTGWHLECERKARKALAVLRDEPREDDRSSSGGSA